MRYLFQWVLFMLLHVIWPSYKHIYVVLKIVCGSFWNKWKTILNHVFEFKNSNIDMSINSSFIFLAIFILPIYLLQIYLRYADIYYLMLARYWIYLSTHFEAVYIMRHSANILSPGSANHVNRLFEQTLFILGELSVIWDMIYICHYNNTCMFNIVQTT